MPRKTPLNYFRAYPSTDDLGRVEAVKAAEARRRGCEPGKVSATDVLRVLLAAWERRGTREGGKDR